jgi:hypothetical protein
LNVVLQQVERRLAIGRDGACEQKRLVGHHFAFLRYIRRDQLEGIGGIEIGVVDTAYAIRMAA